MMEGVIAYNMSLVTHTLNQLGAGFNIIADQKKGSLDIVLFEGVKNDGV